MPCQCHHLIHLLIGYEIILRLSILFKPANSLTHILFTFRAYLLSLAAKYIQMEKTEWNSFVIYDNTRKHLFSLLNSQALPQFTTIATTHTFPS